MKINWSEPSLSRDFTLLTTAVIVLLLLLSSWVTYTTYDSYSQRVARNLEQEAAHIEKALAIEIDNASYLLTALGRQIVLDNDRNLTRLAQTLKSFDSKASLYSIFSFVGTDRQVVVSSNRGVLEHPVNVADRDYVQNAAAEPWKMHIGRPIEGRVSERWVIPVAMGLTDYTGKFIGTIMISIDIHTLSDRLAGLLKREGLSFAVVSRQLIPLAQVSDDKEFVSRTFPIQQLGTVDFSNVNSGLIVQGSRIFGAGHYFFYRASLEYPYVLLLGYDARHGDEIVDSVLWSRLLQLIIIATFFLMFLWIMRTRMITPVLNLTEAAAGIARGERYAPEAPRGPEEIRALAFQLKRISEYIEEIKRIEEELRHKVFLLKKGE